MYREEYRRVNAVESVGVADAFLSRAFLENQHAFLTSKGKLREANIFWYLKTLHPVWSKLI